MRRALKLTVFAVCVILLGAAGLIFGYRTGYEDSAASAASLQSALIVGALRALRENKVDEAIHRLETSLDGNLITYWALGRGWRPNVELFGRDDEHKLLLRASDYRKEYPSQSPSAEVRSWINEIAVQKP